MNIFPFIFRFFILLFNPRRIFLKLFRLQFYTLLHYAVVFQKKLLGFHVLGSGGTELSKTKICLIGAITLREFRGFFVLFDYMYDTRRCDTKSAQHTQNLDSKINE